MHPKRKRRLSLILFILTLGAIACALVLYALRQNISLFYTPTQIVGGAAPQHSIIRVGGIVVKGSIQHDPNSLKVQFSLSDYANAVKVEYEGVLPDLFREEQGVIAQGRLQDKNTIQATQVLAKHDENYMPPEVKAALQPQLLEKIKS